MESIHPFSFSNFPEDVQLHILSFLHQSDLDEFASTSRKLFALCNDDDRLWFLKCSRRWSSQTTIQKWGGGKISYKNLFRFLDEYENLIRFWCLDDEATSFPLLVLFEWGSFYIIGYRILPAKHRGYDVIKQPFLWITATSGGKALNYLDTSGTLWLTDKDLLIEDSEKLRSIELIIVNIVLYGNYHLWMSENPNFLAFRRRLSIENDMAEYEDVYRSPPDGLMTQICKILANKVNFTGPTTSKKEMRRIRKREKLRMSVVLPWKSEHFEKIIGCSPTQSRPLQGLWKGIGVDRSLNLYLVSYDEGWDDILAKWLEAPSHLTLIIVAEYFQLQLRHSSNLPFLLKRNIRTILVCIYALLLNLIELIPHLRMCCAFSTQIRVLTWMPQIYLKTLRMPTGESGYMQMGLLDLGFLDMITFLI